MVGTDLLRIVRSTTSYKGTLADIATYVAGAMGSLAAVVSSIELGHATDTTISRASAGRIAVEGSNVLMASDIGVSVQAYDADLAAWAAVNPSSYSTTAQIAAAYQPLDSDLTAIAALTTTSTGRALLTVADAAAIRTAAELGTSATVNTGTSGATVPLLNVANTWGAAQTISTGGASNSTDLVVGNSQSIMKISGGDGTYAFLDSATWGVAIRTQNTNRITVTNAGAINFATMPTVASVAMVTISSTDTLSNKTLSSPTLSGTVAGNPVMSGQWQWSGGTDAAYWHGLVIAPTDSGTNKPALYITHTSASSYAIGLYDGTDTDGTIQFNCSALSHNGEVVSTDSASRTLSNKTLSSPTLSGTISGAAAFASTVTVANNVSFRVTGSGADVRNAVKMTTGDVMEFATTNNNVTWNAFTHSFITPAGTSLYITNTGEAQFASSVVCVAFASTVASGTCATFTSTDAGAGLGPYIDIYRNSASPATNDYYGVLRFLAKNSSNAQFVAGNFYVANSDHTAGSEDTFFGFEPSVAGAASAGMYIGAGVIIGAPTGSYKGAGTLNCAGDIYKNNTAFTNPDYVFEHFYRGNIVEFAANDGASEYAGLMTLDDLREFTRKNLHLPQVPKHGGVGIFERGDYLLRATEENTLYILSLHERIAELEQKIAA